MLNRRAAIALTRYADDDGDAVGIIYSEARELAKALQGYDTDQYESGRGALEWLRRRGLRRDRAAVGHRRVCSPTKWATRAPASMS